MSSTTNDTNNVIEDIEVTNNSDVMYCNLTHRHSGYDIYHDELNMQDFNKLVTSQQRGDSLTEICLQTRTNAVDTFTPLTKSQALDSMQSAEWIDAEQKEIKR